ncbi:PREDICTED: protein max isoform X4 [Myotis davidii]|uniref:protein max isoform X4 n=1 Tax=Myotis davidii TaxID=225400 RepID=UPI000767C274|nr:PREDICTED: protein max isoform X4 [Myotis davidii]
MQFLMGFVVFLALAGPSVRGTGTTSLGGPSVTSPVTCRRADRACVPPLIRCCSEEADKRAHHNALERKRRDHIKDSFHSLRDSVPSLQGEKSVHWRKRGRVPNCRPTTLPQTTASTPTPRAAPSLPSMGARTPAQSRSLKSPKAGRNSGWRPAKLCRAGQQ